LQYCVGYFTVYGTCTFPARFRDGNHYRNLLLRMTNSWASLRLYVQEAQLLLTNPRDAFRGNQGHQAWYHSI